MDLNNIFNKFDYKDKGFGETIYDAIISPASYALGGKTVTCISKETGSLVDSKAIKNKDTSIEFRVSREKNGFLHGLSRVLAGALAIVISPFIALSLIGKAVSANSKPLSERSISHLTQDNITPQSRVSSSIWGQVVEGITKRLAYSDIQEAAHIQADQQMRDQDNPLSAYEGGLFFQSAKMLRERLEKYENEPQWGADIKNALKMAHEYEDWSYRMAAVMPSRFIGVNPTGLVRDLGEDLKDRINSLKPGEAFLVPVNLKTSNSGSFHTITAQIKHEANGTFSLAIYNVGFGCENHPHTTDAFGNIVSAAPFRIMNISPERMTSDTVLHQFINQATFEKIDETGANFYNFMNNVGIWGKDAIINPKPIDGAIDAVPARKLQKSGTCIWRSPLAAIKGNMPPESYKAFQFAMKRDTMNSIYEKYLKKEVEGAIPIKPKSQKKGKALHAHILTEIGIEEFRTRVNKNKARFANAESDQKDVLNFNRILKALRKPIIKAPQIALDEEGPLRLIPRAKKKEV